jgi:hypothetical protein
MKLGIQLSFVKISELLGELTPGRWATGSARECLYPQLLPAYSCKQCKNVSHVDCVLPLFLKNTVGLFFLVLNVCFYMP